MKRKLKLTHILKEQEEQEELQLSPEQKKQFLAQVKEYNSFRKALQTEADLIKIAEQLSGLAQMAEKTVLAETDDWFDKVTINRNMKELKKINEEFQQTARDAKSVQERMVSLYEDMGHIIGRYFSINPSEQPTQVSEGKKKSLNESLLDKLKSQYNFTFDSDKGRILIQIKSGEDFPYVIQKNKLYQYFSPRTYVKPKLQFIKNVKDNEEAYAIIIKKHNKSAKHTGWQNL